MKTSVDVNQGTTDYQNGGDTGAAAQRSLLGVSFTAPLLLILAKQPWSPISSLALHYFSLEDLAPAVKHSVGHVVLLPLGALIVVFVRMTLGIRVFGPFRSVLLAGAFLVTGIPVGLIFLCIVVGTIVALRRLLISLELSYYARVSVMLSAVGAIVAFTLMVSSWLNLKYLHGIAHFPMVVLCLLAEVFARTLQKEGFYSAIWRGGMTALVAVAITLLASQPILQQLLLRFPELLAVQTGIIVLIARFLPFRFLEQFKPGVAKIPPSEFAQDGATIPLGISFSTNLSHGLLSETPTHSIKT